VVSHEKDKSFWSGSEFNHQRINPGDTIMVPEKTIKPSAMRGVVDWSQMFSAIRAGRRGVECA